MGNWNTLHLFNDKHFYSEIVPRLKSDRSFVAQYFEAPEAPAVLYQPHLDTEARIDRAFALFGQMDEDFLSYLPLKAGRDRYTDALLAAGEDLNKLLTWIVFSECALFNPHFRLGYRLLSYYIDFDGEASLALDCLEKMRHPEPGSLYDNGVFNWLRAEECHLLVLDYGTVRIRPGEPEASGFATDLRKFAEQAARHDLGLICGMNMDERLLSTSLHRHLPPVDWSGFRSSHLIRYEAGS